MRSNGSSSNRSRQRVNWDAAFCQCRRDRDSQMLDVVAAFQRDAVFGVPRLLVTPCREISKAVAARGRRTDRRGTYGFTVLITRRLLDLRGHQ